MTELGGLDMAFVSCETPSMHMHVCGLAVLEPSTTDDRPLFERLSALLSERSTSVAALHHKMLRVPMDLARPAWVDDDQFEVAHHVHRLTLPPGSDRRALAAVIGEIASEPLDLRRPPWEMWAIQSVDDGVEAVLAKVHHSAVDGVGAANIMSHLFDLEPGPARPRQREPDRTGNGTPSVLSRLRSVVRTQALEPLAMARTLPKVAVRVGSAAWSATRGEKGPPVAVPFTAPRLSFNATLSGYRAVAFVDVPLEDVRALRACAQVTFNDVITATVGGALRTYLQAREGLPTRPVIAAEPMAVHHDSEGRGTNRLSVMFANLATDVADPGERLRRVAAANAFAKKATRSVGPSTLLELVEHTSAPAMRLGARLYTGLKLANHHPVIHNLILSTVLGPPVPVYLAGSRILGLYPLGPITDGAGLNITAMSSESTVGFGLVACPTLTCDVWEIAEAIPPALDELGRALGTSAAGRRKACARAARSQRAPKSGRSTLSTDPAAAQA